MVMKVDNAMMVTGYVGFVNQKGLSGFSMSTGVKDAEGKMKYIQVVMGDYYRGQCYLPVKGDFVQVFGTLIKSEYKGKTRYDLWADNILFLSAPKSDMQAKSPDAVEEDIQW